MTRRCPTRSFMLLTALLAAGGGCNQPPPRDAFLVSGLRILGVKAEPPEVAPGQTTMLTVLAVDSMGRVLNLDWAYCSAARPEGEKVNFDCVTNTTASYLTPFGSGLSATLVMPTVDAATLGSADRSGGVYLPIRISASAGNEATTAIYYLRVGMGSPPNNNPSLSGVYSVTMGGTPVDGGTTNGTETVNPLDPLAPLPVKSGDKLTLRAQFTATSAEMYVRPSSSNASDAGTSMAADGGTGSTSMSTENLDVSWFTTAGTLRDVGGGGGFGMGGNGATVPDSTLTLDTNLPTTGSTIDLWVVGRDNRGGTDFQHRTLQLQ